MSAGGPTRRSTPCRPRRGQTTQEPAFDRAAGDLLRAAEEEARGLGDEYVSTEHLLLALAADPAVDAGASREQVAEAVAAVRGPHRVTDQSPEDKYQALERYGRDLTAGRRARASSTRSSAATTRSDA